VITDRTVGSRVVQRCSKQKAIAKRKRLFTPRILLFVILGSDCDMSNRRCHKPLANGTGGMGVR
jgi:hypothetical protein